MNKEEILRQQYNKKFGFQKYDGSVNRKMIFEYVAPAMEIYAIQAGIQERKTHIYVLEQDLMDNGPEGENIYPEDYIKCMKDEIDNHQNFIADLESELKQLTDK
jgi:hypothetical protein